MEQVIKSLAEHQIVLVLVSKLKYAEMTLELIKKISDHFNKICYASFSKPYSTSKAQFEKAGIDLNKFSFIDVLTGTVAKPEENKNVVFVPSANALTDIGLAVSACGNKVTEIFIIEAISTLLVYNDLVAIENFMHHIITKARVEKRKMVIVSIKEESETDLMKDLYVFVDDVVNIEE